MRALVVIALLGGCDKLFDLDFIKTPIDPTGDGGTSDAPPPIDSWLRLDAASPCPAMLMYDEDSDFIDDSCDACPTILSDPSDADLDGLPNACDPNIAPNGMDKILFATTFATFGDLETYYNYNNVTYTTASKGTVRLAPTGNITTITGFSPTKIELNINGFGGGGFGSSLVIDAPNVSCFVLGASCDAQTVGTQTCVQLDNESATGTWQGPGLDLRLVELFKESNAIRCRVTGVGGPGGVSIGTARTFGNGTVVIRTGGLGEVTIRSLVIYGAK